jgi:hypothetical protein
LETQVYQAILERRPAQIIARLKEILAKPDPALVFFYSLTAFFKISRAVVVGFRRPSRFTT